MLTGEVVAGDPVSAVVAVAASDLPLSLRAYARHRKTSAPSVLRAVRSGRLKNSLVIGEDGKAKIADVALADAEWDANTDHSKAPAYVKQRAADQGVTAVPVTDGAPVTPGQPLAGRGSLADASAEEKRWKARLAEQEFLKASGELVNAEKITVAFIGRIVRARTKVLAVPSKFKAAVPDLSLAEVRLLEDLLRQALEDVAESGTRQTSNGAAA